MNSIDWKRHISAQLLSGVTIKSYCERNGISDKSFSFHKSRFKQQRRRLHQDQQPSSVGQEGFAEVVSHHRPPQDKPLPIRVELPGGIIVSVTGKEALREVLSVVGGLDEIRAADEKY